jgi:hypothetical protein
VSRPSTTSTWPVDTSPWPVTHNGSASSSRVLQEALVVRADPLHLAAMFHLSTATAIAYADIARALLERPIEASPLDQ